MRIKKHFPPQLPALMILTDPGRIPDPIGLARRLPPGTGVIYRHFGSENRIDIARALVELAARNALIVLIGGDPILAGRVGAHGVHWPERDMELSRKWRNKFPIVTSAAHSRRSLAKAAQLPIDAALLSTVFPSKSPSAATPMGSIRFRDLSLNSRLPIYALGGVNAYNQSRISDIAGLAMIEGAVSAYGTKT
ncbi:MAG: thiamine phosphate synthase [Pseudomonadota bacterium]